jgi:hypothetical protein
MRPKKVALPDDETVALFVRFVRLNPGIAEDDPVMSLALKAYLLEENRRHQAQVIVTSKPK